MRDPSFRIWVLGPPGAGKTTVARRLHARLAGDYVDLDELAWCVGWRLRPFPEVSALLQARLHGASGCIVDGDYPDLLRSQLPAIDRIIVVRGGPEALVGRVLRRSIANIARAREICGGNRESWARLLGPSGFLRYSWSRARYYQKLDWAASMMAKTTIISHDTGEQAIDGLLDFAGSAVLPQAL